MKKQHHVSNKTVCTLIALSSLSAIADRPAITYFSPRSQAVNAARELVGWTNHVNLYDVENTYGSLSANIAYTRSFRPCGLACCLFGDDLVSECECGIKISGSRTQNRAPTDWLADNFGLPTDYQSLVTFKPRIDNVIIDFNWYLGLDEWVEGLYLRIHAPITHTRWDLNMRETVRERGINNADAGYYGETDVARTNLVNSFEEFITGAQSPTITTVGADPAIIFHGLTQAKWSCCRCIKSDLADLEVVAGYNFYNDYDYHAGINARVSAPTGTRPKGEYFFEPIVGNGHHWEVGAGISGHYTFWRDEDDDSAFGFYLDGNVTHLFKAHQRRVFDLKDKPNSRYMLAQKLGDNSVSDPRLADTFPSLEFANEFTSVANLTCLDVRVSAAVQIDIAAMFDYANGGFTWDAGYNFWYRSCEKICQGSLCPTPLDDGKTWALKGDAFVIGFENTTNFPKVRLAATQSQATIHGGTNFPAAGTTAERKQNPGIDTPTQATSNNTNNVLTGPNGTNPQTHSSSNPLFLSTQDIGINDGRTRGLSHKMFTHLNYTWYERENWIPYLGIGAEAEFASGGKDCCKKSCSKKDGCNDTCGSCSTCALSQWGLWFKGGISWR